MAKISFRGKIRDERYADGTSAYRYIKVPELTRSHCDIAAFRKHEKFGWLANSDLFPNALRRIRTDTFGGRDFIRLDDLPEGVSVDTSSFLAVVSFEV